jgi:hypothetical protein
MTGLEVLCNHGVLSGAIFSPLNMRLNSGPGWCNTPVMHNFDSPDVDGRPCASEAAPPLLARLASQQVTAVKAGRLLLRLECRKRPLDPAKRWNRERRLQQCLVRRTGMLLCGLPQKQRVLERIELQTASTCT